MTASACHGIGTAKVVILRVMENDYGAQVSFRPHSPKYLSVPVGAWPERKYWVLLHHIPVVSTAYIKSHVIKKQIHTPYYIYSIGSMA